MLIHVFRKHGDDDLSLHSGIGVLPFIVHVGRIRLAALGIDVHAVRCTPINEFSEVDKHLHRDGSSFTAFFTKLVDAFEIVSVIDR
jgi:hypothetical protein